MLCCCLDVLALLGPGMFRNTVLLLLWWFKVFSHILEKAVLG